MPYTVPLNIVKGFIPEGYENYYKATHEVKPSALSKMFDDKPELPDLSQWTDDAAETKFMQCIAKSGGAEIDMAPPTIIDQFTDKLGKIQAVLEAPKMKPVINGAGLNGKSVNPGDAADGSDRNTGGGESADSEEQIEDYVYDMLS